MLEIHCHLLWQVYVGYIKRDMNSYWFINMSEYRMHICDIYIDRARIEWNKTDFANLEEKGFRFFMHTYYILCISVNLIKRMH